MDAIDTIKILGSLLGSGGLSKGSGGNVLGNILGSALGQSANQQTQGGGMMGDILGSLLGGGNARTTSGGSMGDLLGGLLKGQAQNQNQSGGGIGDILGSLLGGASKQQQAPQSSGGMGDILGSLLGGGSQQNSNPSAGGLGGLLTGALAKYMQSQHADEPNPQPHSVDHLPQGYDPNEATKQAEILIKAMINAAKSDGRLDKEEEQKILSRLGDLSPAEIEFLKREFSAPLDVEAFAREIPRGMEQQVYALSLSAIDLDTNKEAQYLGELAQALGISPQMANAIHEQLGAPKIFA